MAHCANKHAKEKEKEKNTTTLAIYHGVLLVTMGDLFMKLYTSIKQIPIKVYLYSAVILNSYFWHLLFCKLSIRVSYSCK